MITKWSRWKSILAAIMVGFAEGSGLDVGRPDIHTPYGIVQLDEAEIEIPWEWVPGLIIVPEPDESPEGPEPVELDPKPGRLQKLWERVRDGISRFNRPESTAGLALNLS